MKYHLIFEMSGFDPDITTAIYSGFPENMNSYMETRLRTFAREMLNVQCNDNSKYITDKAIETAIANEEIRYVFIPEVKSKKVITDAVQALIEQIAAISQNPVEVPLRNVKGKSQDAQTKVYATSINPRRDIEAKLREFASLD